MEIANKTSGFAENVNDRYHTDARNHNAWIDDIESNRARQNIMNNTRKATNEDTIKREKDRVHQENFTSRQNVGQGTN